MRSGVLAVLLTLPLATACQLPGGGEGPEDALEQLAQSVTERQLAADLAIEGDHGAASRSLEKILAGVDDLEAEVTAGEVDEDGDRAVGRLHWAWTVAGEEWAYDAEVELARSDDEWRVVWAPTLIEPSLEPGEVLGTTTLVARRGDILGAGGRPIVTQRPVVRFGIDKTQVQPAQAAASADELARLLDVDPAAYRKRVRDSGPKAFVEAIVLREADAQGVPAFGHIPGAVGIGDEIPLAPTREFAAPLLGTVGPVTAELIKQSKGVYEVGDVAGLSGLQARYDEQLRGVDGLQVEAIGKDGAERTLFQVDERNGQPLRITLDLGLQSGAESVLGSVGPASALVAIRPSSGDIVAAASGPGSAGYNTATFGQYAPGSTFKMVTALALLRSGLRPEDTVRCVPEVTVDGKAFENYDDYPPSSLGDIPLREAVAQSCNTALIGERKRIEDGDLTAAAAALGLGVDHDLGFPAYFGQVPPPASSTEAAADLIGQGKVLASPLAMATVIASVSAGRAVLPRLLTEHEVDQQEPELPLTRAEAASLRTLLRAVVTEGSGQGLLDVPGARVIAKTGTAEFVDDEGDLLTHAWMVAAQGDLAVAAFVERGESGSRTAGPGLEAFLRTAGTR